MLKCPERYVYDHIGFKMTSTDLEICYLPHTELHPQICIHYIQQKEKKTLTPHPSYSSYMPIQNIRI